MTAQQKITPIKPGQEVEKFKPFEAKLAAYKKQFAGIVYNLDDKKDNAQARSDSRAIGSTIAKLDQVHKETKAPLKIYVDLIDSERKRIKDDLRTVQATIKGQIDAHEAAKQAHLDALEARVGAIWAHSTIDPWASSIQIAERLQAVKAEVIDDTLEHLQGEAALTKMRSIEALEAALETATTREAEQAAHAKREAEKQDQERAEREDRIAKEAAQRAVDQERLQAEQAARKSEEERIARESNRRHKAQINRAAAGAVMATVGLTEELAQIVIIQIAQGNIPNVTINY